MKLKMNNLGKSALVGLGLSCGVGATPLKRVNTSNNETSLLSARNFSRENVLSSLLVKRDEYTTCVDSRVDDFLKFRNETDTEFSSEENSAWNKAICFNESYNFRYELYNLFDPRYSKVLAKYPTISQREWNIESCLKKHLCIGKFTDVPSYRWGDASGSNCENSIIWMWPPFSEPILPGVPTLNNMLGSGVLNEIEKNGKYAKVDDKFFEECIKPEIETYCRDKENEKKPVNNPGPVDGPVNNPKPEDGNNTATILGIVGGVSATAATIAGILFYRHKKALATKTNNNCDNDPDIDIDIRRGSSLSQHDNSDREIDIAQCSSSQHDNLNKEEDVVINAVSEATSIPDCPPSYEEVARSSSVPQDNFSREGDITMSKSKSITPLRIFAPSHENSVIDNKKDVKAKQKDDCDSEVSSINIC